MILPGLFRRLCSVGCLIDGTGDSKKLPKTFHNWLKLYCTFSRMWYYSCVASNNLNPNGDNKMASAKQVILTAIHFKGTEQVKATAVELADNCLCSVQYVLRLVRQVEAGKITIK